MKNKKRTKKLLIALSILFVASFTCSCKKDQGDGIDMGKLEYDMITADSTLPAMNDVDSSDEKAEEYFSFLADVDYNTVESYFYYYSAESTAHEIAVIKLKDHLDVAATKLALENHINSRITTFETYNPDQVSDAKAAKVVSSGNYVALIMCSKSSDVKKVFLDTVEK